VTHNTATGGPGSGGGILTAHGGIVLNNSRVRNNQPDDCSGLTC
jgi:hypothetical protein